MLGNDSLGRKLRNFFQEERNSFNVFLIMYCFIITGSFLIKPYLWADSVSWMNSDTSVPSLERMSEVIQNLRPIYALLLELSRGWFLLTQDTRLFGIIAVAGAFFFTLSWKRILIILDFDKRFVGFATVGVLALPTFQNYLYDTIMWPMMWTCILVLKAFEFTISDKAPRFKIAVLFLVSANLVYQPISFIYVFLITLMLYRNSTIQKRNVITLLKDSKLPFTIFTISVLLSVVLSLLCAKFLGLELADRTQLIGNTNQLLNKLSWLGTTLFATFLRPFATNTEFPFILLTSIIAVALSLFFVVESMRKDPRFSHGIFFIPIGALASVFPHLVVESNQFEFRSIPGLSLASLIWTLLALRLTLARLMFTSIVKTTMASLLLLGVLINSYMLANELWIEPSHKRDQKMSELRYSGSNLCFVLPKDAYVPIKRLGIYSLRTDLSLSWVQANLSVLSSNRLDSYRFVSRIEECTDEEQLIDFSNSYNSNPLRLLY